MKLKQFMACLNASVNITITLKRPFQEVSIGGAQNQILIDPFYQQMKDCDVVIVWADEKGLDIWL